MVFAYREQKDALAHIQLLDLARVLSRHPELLLDKDLRSYLDLTEGKLALSSFWDDYPPEQHLSGLKSDVYLHAYGSRWHADDDAIVRYLEETERGPLPRLHLQCFALLEQFRWICVMLKERPGMKEVLSFRCHAIERFLVLQLTNFVGHPEAGTRILIVMYQAVYDLFLKRGWLTEYSSADQRLSSLSILTDEAQFIYGKLEFAERAITAGQTADIADCCKRLLAPFIQEHPQMHDPSSTWFHIQPKGSPNQAEEAVMRTQQERFEEKRDKGQFSKTEQAPAAVEDHKETLNSWHREAEQAKDSPFRMDLEQGSLTGSTASGARMTEHEVSEMTVVQGRGQKKEGQGRNLKTPSKRMNITDQHQPSPFVGSKRWTETIHGRVVPVLLPKPGEEHALQGDEQAYADMVKRLQPYIRKIKEQFQKTLEKQRTARRTELWAGRMGKNLIRAVMEPLPRLFYKKQKPDRKLDAVFTLLMDCSASMFDKMEEAKQGAVLFHEVLRSLQIPHQVVGFWEDVDGLSRGIPNYFFTAVSFENSLTAEAGRSIMQLEAQQDNRDGYAIRLMTKQLLQRQEKQKTLIVFCDGEPSAADYFEEGVTDTYLAVQEARKLGIDVMGVFLAGDGMEEAEMANLQQIYGRYGLTVPNMEHLTAQMIPLLKKLIVRKAFLYDI
ncbi:vWA domain-containing protein [Marinicrinis lubricantis]